MEEHRYYSVFFKTCGTNRIKNTKKLGKIRKS